MTSDLAKFLLYFGDQSLQEMVCLQGASLWTNTTERLGRKTVESPVSVASAQSTPWGPDGQKGMKLVERLGNPEASDNNNWPKQRPECQRMVARGWWNYCKCRSQADPKTVIFLY